MRILILIIIGLILLSIFVGSYYFNKQDINTKEKIYQGPVRPTDDEQYFRETGITKLKEVKE